MNKAYNKITWQNKPSTATPLNQTNLNEMSNALDTIDDRVIALDSGKVSSVTVTNTLPTGDTIATITVDGTATNIKSAQITVDNAISPTSTNPVQNKVIYEALQSVMPEVTVEGNPISITDGSDLVGAKQAEVTLLPIQDLHGYDSPWAGGAGKNVVPLSAMETTRNGVTISTVYDSANNIIGYKLNGTASAQTDFAIASGLGLEQGTNRIIYIRETEIAGLTGMITPSYDRTTTSRVLNKAVSGYAIRIDSGTVLNNAVVNPMICNESSGSSFAPYENICPISGRTEVYLTVADAETSPTQTETYTETLGQTVYGGKVDFVRGEGQNDYRSIDENSFSSVTASSSSGGLHWTDVVIGYTPTNIVCDRLARKNGNSGWSSTTPCISYVENGGSKLLRIYCSEGSIGDFKTAYSGLQIVFSRETPATLTLTPTQIALLRGNNVVSTDGNSIKLVYSADIGLYIAGQLQNS